MPFSIQLSPVARIAVVLLIAAVGSAETCNTKEVERKRSQRELDRATALGRDLRDQSGDQNFQAFISRLRLAVRSRDYQTIASMMTETFGYQLEPPLEGDGVFEYWNKKNLWSELELVLREKFQPRGSFMVAPPEFSRTEGAYTGYRAGMINANGQGWRFAYFVNGQ